LADPGGTPARAPWRVTVVTLFPELFAPFLASGVFYYVHYEVLHTAYHLPEGHWLAQRGLVRRLRWLHQTHHDPALMTRYNFNITWPLCDWLFGTLKR